MIHISTGNTFMAKSRQWTGHTDKKTHQSKKIIDKPPSNMVIILQNIH